MSAWAARFTSKLIIEEIWRYRSRRGYGSWHLQVPNHYYDEHHFEDVNESTSVIASEKERFTIATIFDSSKRKMIVIRRLSKMTLPRWAKWYCQFDVSSGIIVATTIAEMSVNSWEDLCRRQLAMITSLYDSLPRHTCKWESILITTTMMHYRF